MKEDLLVVICSLDEAKVILQCGDEAFQSLATAGATVNHPDGNGTLLAASFHFVDRELHLGG